jgi:plastocyanin domain-containing protein
MASYEIVDLPMNKMLDLSIVFCERLPDGNFAFHPCLNMCHGQITVGSESSHHHHQGMTILFSGQ